MRMTRLVLIGALALAMPLAACTTDSTAPPQLPSNVTSIARTSIDTAASAFDAALYGLDFAMDAKLIVPGSEQAKQIAAIGRKVQAALNAASTALAAGNATSAEQAIQEAQSALAQFKGLLPVRATSLGGAPPGPLDRVGVLERAGGAHG